MRENFKKRDGKRERERERERKVLLFWPVREREHNLVESKIK